MCLDTVFGDVHRVFPDQKGEYKEAIGFSLLVGFFVLFWGRISPKHLPLCPLFYFYGFQLIRKKGEGGTPSFYPSQRNQNIYLLSKNKGKIVTHFFPITPTFQLEKSF